MNNTAEANEEKRCWSCDRPHVRGDGGWVERIIHIASFTLRESYCGRCFRAFGWPVEIRSNREAVSNAVVNAELDKKWSPLDPEKDAFFKDRVRLCNCASCGKNLRGAGEDNFRRAWMVWGPNLPEPVGSWVVDGEFAGHARPYCYWCMVYRRLDEAGKFDPDGGHHE